MIEFDGYGEPLVAAVREIGAAVQSPPPAAGKSGGVASPPPDPTVYLRDLCGKTEFIDIRGLQVGKGRANRLPIEELFISLTTTQAGARQRAKPDASGGQRGKAPPAAAEAERLLAECRTVPLHTALRTIGWSWSAIPAPARRRSCAASPTPCARRIWARRRRGRSSGWESPDRTFPVFVRLSELAQHLDATPTRRPRRPATMRRPGCRTTWRAASRANAWGLDADFFRQQLEAGRCTVLLDGLDEAPDRRSASGCRG